MFNRVYIVRDASMCVFETADGKLLGLANKLASDIGEKTFKNLKDLKSSNVPNPEKEIITSQELLVKGAVARIYDIIPDNSGYYLLIDEEGAKSEMTITAIELKIMLNCFKGEAIPEKTQDSGGL